MPHMPISIIMACEEQDQDTILTHANILSHMHYPNSWTNTIVQCNQYPNPSHNLALPQSLAHHNCEDLDPTDTPSAISTTIQAPKLCTHNPSTSQVKKRNHTNPVILPYPFWKCLLHRQLW